MVGFGRGGSSGNVRSLKNWKALANRAGSTLFIAGSTVASVCKEKSKKAFEMSKEKMIKVSNVGKEKVTSTHVYQVASSAANAGKEKAKNVALVASAGTKKAKSVLTVAKQRISRGKKKSQSPLSSPSPRIESVDKEFYRYEMSAEERRKKRAQARKKADKFAPSSSSRSSSRSASPSRQRRVAGSNRKLSGRLRTTPRSRSSRSSIGSCRGTKTRSVPSSRSQGVKKSSHSGSSSSTSSSSSSSLSSSASRRPPSSSSFKSSSSSSSKISSTSNCLHEAHSRLRSLEENKKGSSCSSLLHYGASATPPPRRANANTSEKIKVPIVNLNAKRQVPVRRRREVAI